MPRCPMCEYTLPEDPERVGARCPYCRRALYQPPGRAPRSVQEEDAACTVHAGSAAIGTCARCGNFFCETCRTRWDDAVLCAACVDRALREDGVPGRKRDHARQAKLGLAAGISTWLLTGVMIGTSVLLRLAKADEEGLKAVATFLIVMVLLPTTVIIALLGLGQSAAALRSRGDSMILATLGLLLSGLQVGAMVGAMLFAIWLH